MNDFEERIACCAAQLLAACREAHIFVSGDQRVHEETAAALIGLAPGTLANKRATGDGPAWFRVGGRATYRLTDIARWIEGTRLG